MPKTHIFCFFPDWMPRIPGIRSKLVEVSPVENALAANWLWESESI
jgi:hypothetical protein